MVTPTVVRASVVARIELCASRSIAGLVDTDEIVKGAAHDGVDAETARSVLVDLRREKRLVRVSKGVFRLNDGP